MVNYCESSKDMELLFLIFSIKVLSVFAEKKNNNLQRKVVNLLCIKLTLHEQ